MKRSFSSCICSVICCRFNQNWWRHRLYPLAQFLFYYKRNNDDMYTIACTYVPRLSLFRTHRMLGECLLYEVAVSRSKGLQRNGPASPTWDRKEKTRWGRRWNERGGGGVGCWMSGGKGWQRGRGVEKKGKMSGERKEKKLKSCWNAYNS